jgi:hypothetical protein
MKEPRVPSPENQIEDLQQRLDDGVGAEGMVEMLTEKNLKYIFALNAVNLFIFAFALSPFALFRRNSRR